KDFAILYRTNAQSRTVEEAFVKSNIPYQIVGGHKFYDRKEIKDVMAYLKLVANPADTMSMNRIINTPKRGIGAATVEKLITFADENHYNILDAMGHVAESSIRSEEHTSELQSRFDLVCRLLLEKKEIKTLVSTS